jgi:hypothetical protein
MIIYYIYKNVSDDQLIEEMTAERFRLPTEDEFKFLSGGGKLSLYWQVWSICCIPPLKF